MVFQTLNSITDSFHIYHILLNAAKCSTFSEECKRLVINQNTRMRGPFLFAHVYNTELNDLRKNICLFLLKELLFVMSLKIGGAWHTLCTMVVPMVS